MKKILILGLLFVAAQSLSAQSAKNSPPYQELANPKPDSNPAAWKQLKTPVQLAWGSTDVRYKKNEVPTVERNSRWQAKAWRGERVNAQALLWTNIPLNDVTVAVTDLKNGGAVISASDVTTNFVRYVMTDELNKGGGGGCGHRPNAADWDSSLVADVLDNVKMLNVEARTVQPLWVNVWVPADARPGLYKGTVTVSGANLKPMKLPFEIDVLDRTLPAPKDWKFHLDLWQNPYAVARYNQVPLWSPEHFDAMRPLMKRLADAGQKVVTATLMHKPWAGQTEDHFDNMIFRMKKIDGSWAFDYTVFDKWIDFMMNDVGIDAQINCYTMIPWALTFDYFDQATNRVLFVDAKPGEAAYAEYWSPFLKDFSRHLREKGWFDKTVISMDERPMDAMQHAIRLIQEADPEFKISLAGNYHGEIQGDLYDLSIPYNHKFPTDVKAAREKAGQISTVYICCTEAFPNTFTFSAPAEASWVSVHAVAGNYDGLLRWTYNSWTADPLRDSRFRTWAAGDCYIVYPDDRSSIRMERLIEGIQDAEKIRILREELTKKATEGELDRLNAALATFTPESMAAAPRDPAVMVRELRELLNAK